MNFQVNQGGGNNFNFTNFSNANFNNNVNKPTVSPSIKIESHGGDKETICHSFIRNGFIEYLNDCTHSLAGKKVELPELEKIKL